MRLFDEICRRSLNFIRTCALHDSLLILSVAQYGAIYARSQSITGQNVLFCAQRYHRSIRMLYIVQLIVVLMHLFITLLILRRT